VFPLSWNAAAECPARGCVTIAPASMRLALASSNVDLWPRRADTTCRVASIYCVVYRMSEDANRAAADGLVRDSLRCSTVSDRS
jgi:hypothetical protein